jgi:hypothetical protein
LRFERDEEEEEEEEGCGLRNSEFRIQIFHRKDAKEQRRKVNSLRVFEENPH